MGSSLRLSFVLGKTGWQILSGYLRFLLSFSLCLVGRSADHQPNARSAQTGVADKRMGRFADHSLTGWDALRTITSLSSLIFALSDGTLCGPSTKRAKRTNRRSRLTHGALCGP